MQAIPVLVTAPHSLPTKPGRGRDLEQERPIGFPSQANSDHGQGVRKTLR